MRKWIIQIIVLFSATAVFSVSPDQTFTERALKDNRYFLEFINKGVSNFGTEKNIEQLKEANQHNFNANLWYLQSDYVSSFKEIRASQELMRDLYLDLLTNRYIEDARYLLDLSAPRIVQSKDKKAEMFLRLGYRDLEVSRQYYLKGFNYNRFLFSNKIRHYIDGIKRARRAKRFAFLALIESKTPVEEKDEYRTQTLDEALRKIETEDISDYERVKNLLTNMINRQLFKDEYNFFLHHYDNYGYISEEKENILRKGSETLNTDDVSGKLKPPSSEEESAGVTRKKEETAETKTTAETP